MMYTPAKFELSNEELATLKSAMKIAAKIEEDLFGNSDRYLSMLQWNAEQAAGRLYYITDIYETKIAKKEGE